jgi:hypothetical protein
MTQARRPFPIAAWQPGKEWPPQTKEGRDKSVCVISQKTYARKTK